MAEQPSYPSIHSLLTCPQTQSRSFASFPSLRFLDRLLPLRLFSGLRLLLLHPRRRLRLRLRLRARLLLLLLLVRMGWQYSRCSTIWWLIRSGTGAAGPVSSLVCRRRFSQSTRPVHLPSFLHTNRHRNDFHTYTKGLEERRTVLGRVKVHLCGRRIPRVWVAEEADRRGVVQRQRLPDLALRLGKRTGGRNGSGQRVSPPLPLSPTRKIESRAGQVIGRARLGSAGGHARVT